MHTSLFFSRSISALDLRVNSFISFGEEMLEKCHGNSATWCSSHFALILPVPFEVFSTHVVDWKNVLAMTDITSKFWVSVKIQPMRLVQVLSNIRVTPLISYNNLALKKIRFGIPSRCHLRYDPKQLRIMDSLIHDLWNFINLKIFVRIARIFCTGIFPVNTGSLDILSKQMKKKSCNLILWPGIVRPIPIQSP